MVSIRLKRFGAKKRPYYRIVVMDNRAARTSETIDEVGTYHPVEAEDRQVTLDKEKVESFLISRVFLFHARARTENCFGVAYGERIS